MTHDILINEATSQLDNGAVCIGERHTASDGRQIVRALLKTGLVDTFFIEYDPAGGLPMGDYVNANFREYRDCLSATSHHCNLGIVGESITDSFKTYSRSG